MSTLKPKNLYVGVPANTTVYTSSANVGDYTIIKLINVCNSNTSASKNFTMHVLTPGDNTATANNIVISNFSVPPNNFIQIDTSLVLDSNSSIYITHTGNVSFAISGVEYR